MLLFLYAYFTLRNCTKLLSPYLAQIDLFHIMLNDHMRLIQYLSIYDDTSCLTVMNQYAVFRSEHPLYYDNLKTRNEFTKNFPLFLLNPF